MKIALKFFLIAFLTTAGLVTVKPAEAQVTASVSFSVFHDNLRPYGRWINHSRYGEVWVPYVHGFRPYYTGGHWAYTDYGWTWISDYNWGWAPFHYGRWAYDPAYGWVWIPGYEWGPAWVSWRTGGDYYGWAPLGPDINIGISITFGNTIPADYWVFVPHRYIMSPTPYRYYAPRTRNVTIIKNTTIINNTHETNVSNRKVVVVGGPRRDDVEKVTRTKVQVMHVNNSSRPGRAVVDKNKNAVVIYKPEVNKTTINKEVNKTTVNKEVNKTNNTTTNKTTNNTTINKNSNNKTVNKNQQEPEKKTEPAKKPQPDQNNDNNKPQNNDKDKKPQPNQNNDNNKPQNNDKDRKPQVKEQHDRVVKNDRRENSKG